MTQPFFSVIIPVFNRAHELNGAVRSILAQTFQDFEIVVVDDGSHDDPKAVVRTFDDPRIRYIRQENGGGGAARNRGIDLARGQFVAFLDSDDSYLPHHLEAMHGLVEGTKGLVAYARMIVDRGNGRTLVKPPRAIRPGEHMATYLLCDRGFVPTITIVVEAERARRIRYSETLRAAEDMDFAVRLFIDGARFVMAEEPGAVWNDQYNPNRTSAGRKGVRLQEWLQTIRDDIPARAYYGCMGWAYAKHVAVKEPFRALGYYLTALEHNCYSPKLAAIIFLQIFLPDRMYRRLADLAVAWLSLRRKAGVEQQDAAALPAQAA